MSGCQPELVRCNDRGDVAAEAARRFQQAAVEAVEARGRFVVVLSGGTTPRLLHRCLVERGDLPWRQTVVLFGDERCVPPDHPASNYGMAKETLLDEVPVAANRVFRMRGEIDPHTAAEIYERDLRRVFENGESPQQPRFDLLLLGMGPDGHTASLFPGTTALDEARRWVVANEVSQLETWRLTLTFPALCAARRVMFLVTGDNKASVAAEVFGGKPHDADDPPYPSERVRPTDGTLEVLLDAAAAAELP